MTGSDAAVLDAVLEPEVLSALAQIAWEKHSTGRCPPAQVPCRIDLGLWFDEHPHHRSITIATKRLQRVPGYGKGRWTAVRISDEPWLLAGHRASRGSGLDYTPIDAVHWDWLEWGSGRRKGHQHPLFPLVAAWQDLPQGRAASGNGAVAVRQRARPFAMIEAEDLRSEQRLGNLYLEAVRRGWWTNSNRNVLDFWSLAEKALHEDKTGTPGALFHSLVKRKAVGLITDTQEQRAQQRMSSSDRHDLVSRAADVRPVAPREQTSLALFGETDGRIGYQHSVMMMCFLPQKRLPLSQRDFVVRHGRAALQIEAGSLMDPRSVGVFKRCVVPFGSRARVILPYINSFAVRNRTREIDLGASLRTFLTRLGMSFDGRRGHEVTEQVEALAAAHIQLGQWDGDHPVTRFGRVADAVSFWIDRDPAQSVLWEPTMLLSDQYYEALLERPVPLDMSHLLRLTRSPRRMDLYCWLTYRTARIRKGGQVQIRLSDLQPLFGPDIQSGRHFKHRLSRDIVAVREVYPGFRLSIEGDMLILQRSPPPVPFRKALLPPPG